MKVLITGGAGFIGSHLAEFLREHAEVRILDNLRNGNRRILKRRDVDLIQASVLDTAALRAAASGVDFLFHLSSSCDGGGEEWEEKAAPMCRNHRARTFERSARGGRRRSAKACLCEL